jgi:hypothetical protein
VGFGKSEVSLSLLLLLVSFMDFESVLKSRNRQVGNVQNAHVRLLTARENFLIHVGTYPSVMYVGEALFSAAFPVRHGYLQYPAEAINETLIVVRPFCGAWGIVMPKPAKVAA